ncbi:MAG: cyclic nucleotide-binding domain-containing protein [Acidobacteriota bacterium]
MAKFKVTAPKSIHDSLEPMRTHFPKGSVIFSEGDLGLAMYVIEGGEVEVRKQLGGEERVLATLGKGDFFGEMCMLEEDSPRSATVVAIDDVDAVMIDQSAFTFILRHNPEIAIRMMRKLVVRLRQTTHQLEDAVGHKVDLDDSGITDAPAPPPDPKARLVDVDGGVVFPLADRKETTVGRIDPVTGIHPDVDLTPVDGKRSISRRHARIRRRGRKLRSDRRCRHHERYLRQWRSPGCRQGVSGGGWRYGGLRDHQVPFRGRPEQR